MMRVFRCVESQSSTPLYCFQQADKSWELLERDGVRFLPTGKTIKPSRFLTPVAPTAVYAIGVNYAAHAKEFGVAPQTWPTVFMKSTASVIASGETVRLPRHLRSDKVDYEAELAVIIGRDFRNATTENALSNVLGYTCANDVSARDWQKEWGGTQWSRGKSFDTFCPLGPCLLTADAVPDTQNLDIEFRLNGEVMQKANTSDMLFSVVQILVFLSGSSTVPANSVIITGSPSGVGMGRTPPRWLKLGDTMATEISGIGVLENPVGEEVLG
jgi:2-keto-4-pentenoate hydratase/2-oxohepta-3-ene-1,7-dioic acid hydratase in catechol pathway